MPGERFARLELLLGTEGLNSLTKARVMVLGLGGVGSSCAEALARGGIGSLVLLDRDIIEESNINRQKLAFTSTLGREKAEVMAQIVADINPECTVFATRTYLDSRTLEQTLDRLPRPDYVLDCIDTLTQKLGIARWCAKEGIPLISSMGAANKFDPTKLHFCEVQESRHCHLARAMRRECRHRGIADLEVLSSQEAHPSFIAPKSWDANARLGSMSYMPPIMGQMLAGQVIQRLAGLSPMPTPPRLVDSWRGTPCSRG